MDPQGGHHQWMNAEHVQVCTLDLGCVGGDDLSISDMLLPFRLLKMPLI